MKIFPEGEMCDPALSTLGYYCSILLKRPTHPRLTNSLIIVPTCSQDRLSRQRTRSSLMASALNHASPSESFVFFSGVASFMPSVVIPYKSLYTPLRWSTLLLQDSRSSRCVFTSSVCILSKLFAMVNAIYRIARILISSLLGFFCILLVTVFHFTQLVIFTLNQVG